MTGGTAAPVALAGRAPAHRRATLVGALAPLPWASLALLTTEARPIPPFELVFLTFGVAFLMAVVKWGIDRARGGPSPVAHLRLPWRVWALGVGGLFGYHVLYFNALGRAPAVEASLICYLWPLLTVLFSALLPGERLASSISSARRSGLPAQRCWSRAAKRSRSIRAMRRVISSRSPAPSPGPAIRC